MWREGGLLASRPSSARRELNPAHLQVYSRDIQEFYHSFRRAEAFNVIESFRAITYRFRMVELWQLYQRAALTIPDTETSTLRPGQTKQSRYKRHLFNVLYPEFTGVTSIHKNRSSRPAWTNFTYQLANASRWFELQEALGPGVLGLITERRIPKSWVESTLKQEEFRLWIEVIKYFNPRCQQAGIRFKGTLDRALAGKQLSRRRRRIEGVQTASMQGFTETSYIFDDESGQSEREVTPQIQDSNQMIEIGNDFDSGFQNLVAITTPDWGYRDFNLISSEQMTVLGSIDSTELLGPSWELSNQSLQVDNIELSDSIINSTQESLVE